MTPKEKAADLLRLFKTHSADDLGVRFNALRCVDEIMKELTSVLRDHYEFGLEKIEIPYWHQVKAELQKNATMTYEERVRSVAEEMAAQKRPLSFKLYNKYRDKEDNGWSHDFYVKNWQLIVDGYVMAARIAVKHMAEMYQTGFIRFLENSEHTAACERICSREMQELGLVPDKEDGNND